MKEDSPFSTGILHAISRFFNGFGAAGDDDLPGQLKLTAWTTPPSLEMSAQISLILSSAKPRMAAIPPSPRGSGFLHELTAKTDRPYGIGKGQGTGGDEGRIFTETVTGCDVRQQAFLCQDTAAGRAGRKDGRLCIIGLHQFFVRTFKAKFRQREPQCVISFFKELFYNRVGIV